MIWISDFGLERSQKSGVRMSTYFENSRAADPLTRLATLATLSPKGARAVVGFFSC
jgi:hypothetical protein